MENTTGTIFNIQKFSVHDGPGIRTTVFLKGCPLSCWWCHNPEGQNRKVGAATPTHPDTSPVAGDVEGRTVTAAEVVAEIEKDLLFFDDSGGGATFSGGEPLAQPAFLTALIEGCGRLSIHTVLDTTGFAPAPVLEAVLKKVDLVFYDLKLVDDAPHRRFTGVPVGPVLDNLRRLARGGSPFVIRFPLVPGITDAPGNLEGIRRVVRDLPRPPERIDVLPFHHFHTGKYARLGRRDPMAETPDATAAEAESAAEVLRRTGLTVTIGGET